MRLGAPLKPMYPQSVFRGLCGLSPTTAILMTPSDKLLGGFSLKLSPTAPQVNLLAARVSDRGYGIVLTLWQGAMSPEGLKVKGMHVSSFRVFLLEFGEEPEKMFDGILHGDSERFFWGCPEFLDLLRKENHLPIPEEGSPQIRRKLRDDLGRVLQEQALCLYHVRDSSGGNSSLRSIRAELLTRTERCLPLEPLHRSGLPLQRAVEVWVAWEQAGATVVSPLPSDLPGRVFGKALLDNL